LGLKVSGAGRRLRVDDAPDAQDAGEGVAEEPTVGEPLTDGVSTTTLRAAGRSRSIL